MASEQIGLTAAQKHSTKKMGISSLKTSSQQKNVEVSLGTWKPFTQDTSTSKASFNRINTELAPLISISMTHACWS